MNDLKAVELEALEATNELQKLLRKMEGDVKNRNGNYEENDVGSLRILEELCLKGADLNYLERERGFVCITHVFWSVKLIKFFVDKGLDVNSRNEDGNTVLHLAISHGNWALTDSRYDSERLINFLLYEASADPNIANLQGENALFTLLKVTLNLPYFGREFTFTRKVARMLLEKGANIATVTGDGESMLHLRISCFTGLLNQAFEVGDIDARTSSWLYSKTPLMAAASRNNVKLCRMLIEKGASINATDLQGYTALHHAVGHRSNNSRRVKKCAEFLIKMGANPNAKSESGKDVYDVSICNHRDEWIFTYGAEPTRQAELYEIAGAIALIKIVSISDNPVFEHWDKVLEICEKHDLQPTPEFLNNFEFLRQNLNSHTPGSHEEIRLSAMNTIARLSRGTSKFWNFISLFQPCLKSFNSPELGGSRLCFLVFLEIMTKELELRAEKLVSFEEADFEAFRWAIKVFDDWIVKFGLKSKSEATPERISLFHSFANLVICCLDKLLHETGKKTVSHDRMDTCLILCHSLMLIRKRFYDIIAESNLLNENERLLRNLFGLDLRDGEYDIGDSLIHLILRGRNIFESDLILSLLDFEFVNVTIKNRRGLEPVQCVNWSVFGDAVALKIFVKMAKRSAHVDATNIRHGTALAEMFERHKFDYVCFRYDSLQCVCARFLARSLVPYRSSWLPKQMIDFIDEHYV